MRVQIDKTFLRMILRRGQWALFTGATLMLGYCAFIVGDTWMFQHRENRNFERVVQKERHKEGKMLQATAPPSPALLIGADGLIGRIEILRLGVSVMVMEGTKASALRHAAGHIAGTALPGQPGNMGIAAHRDTFFRPLRNIQHDDIILLTTLGGDFRYRVVSTRIVSPYNVAVLDPDDGSQLLTLVTCYPFYFVGSAPSRFIVRAERIT